MVKAEKLFCLVVESTGSDGERGVDAVHGPITAEEVMEGQEMLRERLWGTVVAMDVTVTVVELQPLPTRGVREP